jgi:hypothetical protein
MKVATIISDEDHAQLIRMSHHAERHVDPNGMASFGYLGRFFKTA